MISFIRFGKFSAVTLQIFLLLLSLSSFVGYPVDKLQYLCHLWVCFYCLSFLLVLGDVFFFFGCHMILFPLNCMLAILYNRSMEVIDDVIFDQRGFLFAQQIEQDRGWHAGWLDWDHCWVTPGLWAQLSWTFDWESGLFLFSQQYDGSCLSGTLAHLVLSWFHIFQYLKIKFLWFFSFFSGSWERDPGFCDLLEFYTEAEVRRTIVLLLFTAVSWALRIIFGA